MRAPQVPFWRGLNPSKLAGNHWCLVCLQARPAAMHTANENGHGKAYEQPEPAPLPEIPSCTAGWGSQAAAFMQLFKGTLSHLRADGRRHA